MITCDLFVKRSEQIMSEFVQCIFKCVQEDVMSKMKQSDTISLMIDESTDVSILKQLVVYGRGVVNGELECHFLGMRDLFNGTAETIETSLCEFLSIPYLARFKEILTTLFYYFHNSAVRQSTSQSLKMYVGYHIKQLWMPYVALVLTSLDCEASERENPTASGLRKFILKYFFVADILPYVCKLSRIMQSSSLDFSILEPVLDSCKKSIDCQKTTPGKYTADLSNLIQRLDEAGHHIDVNDRLKSLFDSQVKMPYIEALLGNVRDRFASIDIISAFQIFVPKQLPEDESELYHYGVSDLDCLIEHYSLSPLQLSDGIYDEWNEFKTFLANSIELKTGTIQDLAKFMLCSAERRQLFPTLSTLLVRGLVLPIVTADCERGFSAMNRIKTTPRNRLKTTTLEQLMFIFICR